MRSPSQSERKTLREKTRPFLSSLPTLFTRAALLMDSSALDWRGRERERERERERREGGRDGDSFRRWWVEVCPSPQSHCLYPANS